jgi:hypothetical protein
MELRSVVEDKLVYNAGKWYYITNIKPKVIYCWVKVKAAQA